MIVGYELLVRLRNAAGELWRRTSFSRRAAQYGLLAGAGSLGALLAAVERCGRMRSRFASAPLFFAINVSAQSLAEPQVRGVRAGDARRRRLPPSLFCFELKEPAAVADLAAADALIRELTRCRRQGRARRLRLGLELDRASEAAAGAAT